MFKFIDVGPFFESLDAGSEFIAFDLETTGLNPQGDRITEIGAVRFSLTEIKGTFETLVNPGRPIPADATRVSGITDEMVRDRPRIAEVIGDFLEFAGRFPFIAHNARFDGGFIREVLVRMGLPLLENTFFDTRLLSKKLWPQWKSYRLDKVLETLCLPAGALHRGLADAQACREVFLSCVKKIGESAAAGRRVRKRVAFVLTKDDVDEPI